LYFFDIKNVDPERHYYEVDCVINFLMLFRDCKNFKGIDLLPYHKLGVNKYTQLGIEYPIEQNPGLNSNDLDRIESWIKNVIFPVSIIKY